MALVRCSSLLLLLAIVGCAFALRSNANAYEGTQVLSVDITSQHQADALIAIVSRSEQENWRLRLWTDKPTVPGVWDLQVPREAIRQLAAALRRMDIAYTVLHEDLGRDIDALMARNEEIQASAGASFFDSYASLAQMTTYLAQLTETYSMASLVNIGTTIEGRNITGVTICSTSNCESKPAIVFNGGQHAREWLSPMTVAYILNGLLSNYTTDSSVKEVVDAFEWTIIPIVNADGYVYTWTDDRMWRKNRRQNEGSPCYGVDTNRNWDYEWGGEGASPVACTDTYYGTAGFSEPEETAVANLITKNGRVQFYIDFHMYGSLFMYPWGYTCDQYTQDATIQQSMADEYQTAVKAVNGVTFTTGPVCQTIYVASGGSNDWTYGAADAVYSYACELRGSTFLEPATEIIPSGQEQFAGILAAAQFVMANPMPPSL